MNLYHLRYFSTLAHIEHYTKAADILAITQPSLSYAISTLEEELKGLKAELAALDRKIQLELAPPQEVPKEETAQEIQKKTEIRTTVRL